MKFSKTTGGFYSSEFHSEIPNDAVDVSDDEYHAALQHNGLLDVADGRLVLKPPPPLTSEEMLMTVRAQLLLFRQQADTAIAPLVDAVDIGIATGVEKETLIAWKKYRVLLNRVPDQPGWPTDIHWPDLPLFNLLNRVK